LREKLAHKAEDNIGLSQTTQSIVIIISHGGGSCSTNMIIQHHHVRRTLFGSNTYFSQKICHKHKQVMFRIRSPMAEVLMKSK